MNNPFEIITLNKVHEVMDKITDEDKIANFIAITDFNKIHINFSRYNFFGMLTPMNRKKAKDDFINLARESFVEDKLDEFENEYPLERDAIETLKWYTCESFFYRLLNKGLRTLHHPKECFYLRLPFSDLFCSIREMFHNQENDEFRQKEFVCYRGC